MKPLNGYCIKCLGCNKLESESFHGAVKCIAFKDGYEAKLDTKNLGQQIILGDKNKSYNAPNNAK